MRLVASSLGAAAIAFSLAANAGASEHIRLEPLPGEAERRSWILAVPPSSPVDVRSVRVYENGRPVKGLRAVSNGGTAASRVALIIDASQSMHRGVIGEAMRAARSFAARRGAEQHLGVATFNREPRVVVAPTTDDGVITEALKRTPDLAPGTNIFDAVGLGLRMVGRGGTIVLLSDGDDTGSRLPAESVIGSARRNQVRVFAVGLESNAFNPSALRGLASETGGTYTPATSPRKLRSVFDALGARLASEIRLDYPIPQRARQRVDVAVDVDGGRPDVTASYVAGVPAAAATPNTDGFWASSLGMATVAILCALLLACAAALFLRRPATRLEARLSPFVAGDGGVARHLPLSSSEADATRRFYARVERTLNATAVARSFAEDVDVARLPRSASEIATWIVVGTGLVVALLALAGAPVAAAAALVSGPAGGWSYVRSRARAQRRRFEEQLADNLQVVASALRAGHSFAGALASVVDDAPEPARREFARIRSDERLGVPLEECINRVAKRMKNRDLPQVAVVAALQHETGGNTAEVLDRVVDAVRARGEVRRLIRTLTAQGRLAHVILTFLPAGLAGALFLMNPKYFDPLFESNTGRALVVAAITMTIAGSVIIKRIVDIKV